MSPSEDGQGGLALEWQRGLPLLLLVIIVAGVAAFVWLDGDRGAARRSNGSIRLGSAIPDVTLRGPGGGPVSTSEITGAPMVIHFYASWCVRCDDDISALANALDHSPDGAFGVLGIVHDDDAETSRQFAADRGATWPSLADPDGSAWAAFDAIGPPISYFVDERGIVRDVVPGPLDASELRDGLAAIGVRVEALDGAAATSRAGLPPAQGSRDDRLRRWRQVVGGPDDADRDCDDADRGDQDDHDRGDQDDHGDVVSRAVDQGDVL